MGTLVESLSTPPDGAVPSTTGGSEGENIHMDGALSDWTVSMDQLQGLAPGVQAGALVVSWFGTDLRCGECLVRPAVENAEKVTTPHVWHVAGLDRASAPVISQVDGAPVYGGTPNDGSVIRAIRDLAERGIACMYYPFIMMDILPGNALSDPYGRAEQPPFPWRGRITCHPAPGQPSSPDGTAAAADQVRAFMGDAQPSDFRLSGDTVIYSGPDEWRFRRFILHQAMLCRAAGGVESFLIGSELRGLTTIRDGVGSYPFVRELIRLAADVKSILPDAQIGYAADWSEYFGHHLSGGELFFHLDPLWADGNIDFIGIDNYMPLSDWRDGMDHLDARAGWTSIYDLDYLKANIAGGEGFDWYYASDADRDAQRRTPITDGAYGKDWVWRYKDLVSWWGNYHYDRPGGVEAAEPTPWVPRSKPIRFTEFGCPAVDKGPNQPNVFYDPKSSESALPYYSNGVRDDAIQRQYLAAHLEYWGTPGPHNPVSEIYGGTMVDTTRMYAWAWDARPWPAWPGLSEVWSDGPNHEFGHWLNGRLGNAPVSEIVRRVLDDHGFAAADVEEFGHMVTGLTVSAVSSARAVIEPLSAMFEFDAVQSGDRIAFRRRQRPVVATIDADSLAELKEGEPLHAVTRAQETELPALTRVDYLDAENDHRSAVAEIRWPQTSSSREESVRADIAMRQGVALARAHCMLAQARAARETLETALPPSMLELEPGDVVEALGRRWRIERLTDGLARQVRLVSYDDAAFRAPVMPSRASAAISLPTVFGAPAVLMLDTPLLREQDDAWSPWMAAHASPWPGEIAVMRQLSGRWRTVSALTANAAMGELLEPLPAGPQWVWDRANAITVRLWTGILASETEEAVFGGANAAAVGDPHNGWEIVQFRDAELVAPGTWRLTMLLRGQRGSGPELVPERPAGSFFVLLNGALAPLPLSVAEKGADITLRAGPSARDMTDDTWTEITTPYRGRAARPFAPVHLRGTWDGDTGDLVLTWMRRTRIGGDAWTETEPPLGEAFERYRVEILDAAGQAVRVMEVAEPRAVWTAAQQREDFPAGGDWPGTVRVAQISETYGPGAWTQEVIG